MTPQPSIDNLNLHSLDATLQSWWHTLIDFGIKVLIAIVVLIVGRWVIALCVRWLRNLLMAREVEPGVVTFFASGARILLFIVLVVGVLSTLGFAVVSFTALLASMGVAIGMALSSDLKNFAGGLVLLITRPIRVGDFIEAQGQIGTVDEIRIFHTVLSTPDNRTLFIPNGVLSSGAIINYSLTDIRRFERVISIEYGSDFNKAKEVIEQILAIDTRVLKTPAPSVVLVALADSSVDIQVHAWTPRDDYWATIWDFNQRVYSEFNRLGISFPFPTINVVRNS